MWCFCQSRAVAVSLGLLLFQTLSVISVTRYVDAINLTPVAPYTNWHTAAVTIQDAVDAAVNGDTVLVTNGVYDRGGAVTPGYSLSNRVMISKGIMLRSVNGPENTIICGAPALMTGEMGTNAVRGVYINTGILSGFTVSNGYTQVTGNPGYETSGGGIWCTNGCIITNCVIAGSGAETWGGCVWCFNGGTLNNCTISGNIGRYGGGSFGGRLERCIVRGNSAESGGGIYFHSRGMITDSIVSNNTANHGGGIYGSQAGTIVNCEISGNSAIYGGGVACEHGMALYNCMLNSNSAEYGGGVYCDKQGIVSNCTFSGNNAIEDGGGVYWHIYCNVLHCTINGNTAHDGAGIYCKGSYDTNGVINHSIIMGNSAAGSGGGIYCYHNSVVKNSVIAANTCKYFGGGLYLMNYSFASNCVITGNSSDNFGGGILLSSNSARVNNCMVYDNYAERGGGVYYLSGGLVSNCIIRGNTASEEGGGVYQRKGVLVNSEISSNSAYSGGGMWCTDECLVTNCYIQGNTASHDGGGVYCVDYTPCFIDCTLRGNISGFNGGGMHLGTAHACLFIFNHAYFGGGFIGSMVDNSSIISNTAIETGGGGGIINNCLIQGNRAQNGGGTGFGFVNNSHITGNRADGGAGGANGGTINNCLITGNQANYGGGSVYATLNNCTISGNTAFNNAGGASLCTLHNSIIYYNSAPVSPDVNNCYLRYSCSTEVSGNVNISYPPQFVDSNTGNYRLQSNSPCINRGKNDYSPGEWDLDGNNRIIGCMVDIGAYEYVLTGAWIYCIPREYDYGDVVISEEAVTSVRIYNWGTGELNGYVSNVSAPFSVVSGGFYRTGTCSWDAVVFRFAPEYEGIYSNAVLFMGGGGTTVVLMGTGVPEPEIALVLLLLGISGIRRTL